MDAIRCDEGTEAITGNCADTIAESEVESDRQILQITLDELTRIAAMNTLIDASSNSNPTEYAVQKGLLHRLKGQGITGETCSICYFTYRKILASFHIKAHGRCEYTLEYQPGSERITYGEEYPIDIKTVNPNILSIITPIFIDAEQLIKDELTKKRASLTSALEETLSTNTNLEDAKLIAQEILKMDDALSGLNALLKSEELRNLYLSEDEIANSDLENNPSGYDCGPARILRTIQESLAALNAHHVGIGARLSGPLRETLNAFEQDLIERSPLTLTGSNVRQRIMGALTKWGIILPKKSTISLGKTQQIEELLATVKINLEIMLSPKTAQFTTNPYLNAILEVAEPEWDKITAPQIHTP
jgi:hypothetical protein